jgi:hypothetical protein
MSTQTTAIVKHHSPPLSWLIWLGHEIVTIWFWCVRKIRGTGAPAATKPLSRSERKALRKTMIREAQNPRV